MNETKPIWLRLNEKDRHRIEVIASRDDRSVAYTLKKAVLAYANLREASHGRAK